MSIGPFSPLPSKVIFISIKHLLMITASSPVADPNENQILLAARMVREHYFADRKKDRPDWILIIAIQELLARFRLTRIEDLIDLLINRSTIKTEGHLSRYVAASVTADAALTRGKTSNSFGASVFTGGRTFSFIKLSAMTAFITLHADRVCKQKLNHLLFYGDFVGFFLYGRSISGARYVRRPSAPALYEYERLLKALLYSGVVRFNEGGVHANDPMIVRDRMILGELTIQEIVTMNWVLANFGSMNGTEIGQYVHREIAHRFTRQDGFIAYEYSKLLQKLPDRSMF